MNDKNLFGQGFLMSECITGHFTGQYILTLADGAYSAGIQHCLLLIPFTRRISDLF